MTLPTKEEIENASAVIDDIYNHLEYGDEEKFDQETADVFYDLVWICGELYKDFGA